MDISLSLKNALPFFGTPHTDTSIALENAISLPSNDDLKINGIFK